MLRSILIFFLVWPFILSLSPLNAQTSIPIPTNMNGGLSSMAFNHRGDFVTASYDEESNTSTIIFKEQVLTVPDMVSALTLDEKGNFCYENFIDLKETRGIFCNGKAIHQELTRFHHRFSRIYPLAEGRYHYVMAMDAQDLHLFYFLGDGKKKKTLITEEFACGKEEGINYLFIPSFNRQGDFALKIQRGSRETISDTHTNRQEILYYSATEHAFKTLFSASMVDEKADFYRLGNSLHLNEQGHVVFIGNDWQDKHVSKLFFYKKGDRKTNVKALADAELEYFEPVMNTQNQVAYFARGRDGRRALKIWNPDAEASERKSKEKEQGQVQAQVILREGDNGIKRIIGPMLFRDDNKLMVVVESMDARLLVIVI